MVLEPDSLRRESVAGSRCNFYTIIIHVIVIKCIIATVRRTSKELLTAVQHNIIYALTLYTCTLVDGYGNNINNNNNIYT